MPGVALDRVQKQVLLKASRERVWQALIDSAQFGSWFGARFDAPFEAGKPIRGRIVGTAVDAEVAAMQHAHAGMPLDITVERIEPEHVFSFRWHPNAVDAKRDYSKEPTTLVEFTLDETPDGILLTVTESGFDRIPLDRRAEAFKANEAGWTIVTPLIGKYLAQHASSQA
jgi:uncharacterized protein YndB with AHSA1/START domain